MQNLRGGKNNQDRNKQNKQSFVYDKIQEPLLLLSACHNIDIVYIRVSVLCACGDGWGGLLQSMLVAEPMPPHLSDRLSICRCTACYQHLHSTSAEKKQMRDSRFYHLST